MRLQSQLLIEPGVLNHLGCLHRQFLEQFLIFRAEGVRTIRIHVEHAARFPVHFQRHGQFRPHTATRHHVARVLRHVADARGLAGARNPAGDAFPNAQFEPRRRRRQVLRRVDFQKARCGIDQDHRTARRVYQPHRFAYDQLQRFLGFKRGMNDIAHLIEQLQSLVTRHPSGMLVTHN